LNIAFEPAAPSLFLAAQIGHYRRGVARAGSGIPRHGALDCGHVLRAQPQTHRSERLGKTIAAAGTDEGYDVVPPPGYSGDVRLRDADTHAFGDLAQGLHQPEVGVDVGSLKAWAVRPEITGSGGILLPVAADEAPREQAIGSFERGRLAR
jgi:hypothetical protein